MCTTAREALDGPLWHRTNISPSWTLATALARGHSLRDADLWHLAAAKDLQRDLPELALASFDERLLSAAAAEGFGDKPEVRSDAA